MSSRPALLALAAVLVLAGCGSAPTRSSNRTTADPARTTGGAAIGPPDTASSSTISAVSQTTPVSKSLRVDLRGAEYPERDQFPAVRGRTLEQVAQAARASAQLIAATGVYNLGSTRYAFGLNSGSNELIYAPTAVYIAASPEAPASGPYLAPADPMAVAPQYRSKQNDPDAVRAVYGADLPAPRPGVYAVLAMTRTARGFIGSSSEIAVPASSPIPGVGQRTPAIATDTPSSVRRNIGLLTTRQPPENMHSVSFNQVLGKRPIALLISTPALCESRVCGPVTDIMVELQHQFGDRIDFIHEEVYVDNDPSKGLRPQLKALHIQTEPWLFTVNAKGIITSRLNGAFGVNEARAAVEAALN